MLYDEDALQPLEGPTFRIKGLKVSLAGSTPAKETNVGNLISIIK